MITDEFGADPTLRSKNTSVNVNALTMISKRVDVFSLLQKNREALSEVEMRFRWSDSILTGRSNR